MTNDLLLHVSFKAVEGKPVVLPGYEEFSFFIHDEDGSFIISEVTTGYSINSYYRNKTEAVREATAYLDLKGIERLREAIAKYAIMVVKK